MASHTVTAPVRSPFAWALRGWLAALLVLTAYPRCLSAQQHEVSGTVVERNDSSPVAGAIVRIDGYPPASTGVDGRFRLSSIATGRHRLEIEALGYHAFALDLVVQSDTTLNLELELDPLVLDTLAVSAQTITISGVVRDSVTGLILLQGAAVTTYPRGRSYDAQSGRFSIPGIPRGQPVGLLVEALEYLPKRIEFVAAGDTALEVRLDTDSVAVRLIHQQVERLNRRSNTLPHSVDAINRDEIMRAGVPTAVELIRRRLPPGTIPSHPPYSGSIGNRAICVLLDDMPSSLADVAYLPPGLIERVEIVGYRGRMIRVYTKRYVARLMRVGTLPPITYMDNGMGTVCW